MDTATIDAVMNEAPPPDDQLQKTMPSNSASSIDAVMNEAPPSDEQLNALGFKRSYTEMQAPSFDTAVEKPPGVEISKTGQTVAPLSGWAQTYQGLERGWVQGTAGLAQSREGWQVAFGKKFEEAEQAVASEELTKAMKDSEDYANDHGYFDAVRISELAGNMTPTLGLTFAAGGVAAGAAFLLSAPVTLPALTAMAAVGGTIAFGQGVFTARQRKVDPTLALGVGLASATLAAGTTFIGTGALGETVSVAAAQQLASVATKEAALKTVTQIAKTAGLNIGLPTLQTFVNSVLTSAAASVSKNGRPMTWKEIEKATTDTLAASAIATPILMAGGYGAGKLGGMALQKGMKHEEAAAAISNLLDYQTEQTLKMQQEAELNASLLKGYVTATEKEAIAAEKEAAAAQSKAESLGERASEAEKAALKEKKDAETEYQKFKTARIVEEAQQADLAEFGPAKFTDEERYALVSGNPTERQIAYNEAETRLANLKTTIEKQEQLLKDFIRDLREEPSDTENHQLLGEHTFLEELQAEFDEAAADLKKLTSKDKTRETIVKAAISDRVKRKIQAIRQRTTSGAADIVAQGERAKAEIAAKQAESAKARAEEAKEEAAFAKSAVAKAEERLQTIPNRDLPIEQRRIITRAGLAIRVKKNVGMKVLDKLAETGSYEEAAKVALRSEVEVKEAGNAKQIRNAGIYKDTAGLTLAGKLRYIFQHAAPEEVEQLVKALDIQQAADNAEIKRAIYIELGKRYLEEATGLKAHELDALMYEAANTTIDGQFSDGRPIGYTDQAGNLHKLSVDQAMSYVLWSENSDAQAALFAKEGNNFPRDFEISIRDAIQETKNGGTYLAALDGFRGFYEETGPILKEVHDRATGLAEKNAARKAKGQEPAEGLKLQINYGGTIRRANHVDASLSELSPLLPGTEFREGTEIMGVTNRATIERAALQNPITPAGAFANMVSHAKSLAQYEAMIEPAKLWRAFVNDPTVKSNIAAEWNKDLHESIQNTYLDAVHGTPASQQGRIAWVDNVMRANRLRALGMNPIYTPQHWFTLGNFFLARHNGELIPGHQLAEQMLKFTLHPIKMTKEIMSWEIVQERYKDTNVIGGIARGEADPKQLKYEEGALRWFRLGDKPACIWGTAAVYNHVLKKTGNAAEAKAVAIQAFENVLASGQAHQWTDLTTNRMSKIVVQFEQPMLRLRQHGVEAKLRADNFKTPKNIANQVRTETISRLAGTLFLTPKLGISFVEGLITGNYGSVASTVLRMSTTMTMGNMIPVVNVIGTTVTAALFGLHHEPEESIPPLEAAVSAANASRTAIGLANGETKWTLHNMFKIAIDATQAATLFGVGIPYKPLSWLDHLLTGGK